ncbi:hypothetical protein AAFF_G00097060 [Aldrovandia affinis]|uniref:Uncharacterized protein n=1 Tax=Aldrovandia affinis TaxID=143900 RepID=A0AAD7RVP5_9TELE|nr:hypothetical protein AAFF_G00097060 [Aldrovandia affinis]
MENVCALLRGSGTRSPDTRVPPHHRAQERHSAGEQLPLQATENTATEPVPPPAAERRPQDKGVCAVTRRTGPSMFKAAHNFPFRAPGTRITKSLLITH